MEFPARVVSHPILVIDKNNYLASSIANCLADHTTTIVVSQEKIESEKDIIHVPYLPPLPQIPNGMYRSIIFVWEEKQQHLLGPLLQKAQELQVPFYVVTSQEEKQFLPQDMPSATILVVGDLFDEEKQFPLTDFLKEAKTKKHIQLADMGLQEWYPVRLSDAVEKICQIIVQQKHAHAASFVGPMHKYTSLTIAHGLQKVDPDITIDFIGGINKAGYTRAEASVFESYDSIKKLQEVYKRLPIKRLKELKEVSQVAFGKPKKRKGRNRWELYVLYLFCVSILVPPLVAFVSAGIGLYLLSSSFQDVKSASFSSALAKASAAEQNFSLSQSAFGIVSKEMGVFGKSQSIDYIYKEVATGKKLSQLSEKGIHAFQLLKSVLGGKTLSSLADSEGAAADVQQAEILLQEINVADLPKQYQALFTSLQHMGEIFSGTESTLPQVLGVGGTKTYLVLFQNNMELRPGGGFIGSYGLLALQNGAVKSFTIHDVYDADGQLKGHIEPPFAIRRYMPLVHLYLRDSNFDPDFIINGKKAAFILSQETGEKVDGVIGVDLNVLQTVLSGVGSVYVPSYNQTVTSKNFFTLLEEHAEKNFFPGSTQKKDFLRGVANALISKFQGKLNLDLSTVMSQVIDLLEGKHVLVSFSDSSLESPFALAGLSSSLSDVRASSSGTMNDFLGITEANLGVNKANAYVTRSLAQQVTIDEKGNAIETATVTLHNTSNGTWPGGAYKNYIRFMLPSTATVTNIALNNVDQKIISAITDPKVYEAKAFTTPKGLEVAKENEAGKILYGFLIIVPVEATLSIQISYTIPRAFVLSNQKMVYSNFIWKQAGVNVFPYTLTLNVPQSYAILGNKDNMSIKEINDQIKKDSVYTVFFGEK